MFEIVLNVSDLKLIEIKEEYLAAAEMLEKISEGIAFEGMESLIPLLVDETETLLSRMPENTQIVFIDEQRIKSRAADLLATNEEFLNASWSNAALGGSAPIHDGAGTYMDWQELFDEITKAGMSAKELSPFGTPKIFLAGVGELMTEVAGEVCDGFLCHGFTTEKYLREVTIPALARGRAKAGKSVLMDLSLFRIRRYGYGNVVATLVSLGEFGVLFALPLWLQSVQSFSALQTGALLAILGIGAVLAGDPEAIAGVRDGWREPVVSGAAAIAGYQSLSAFGDVYFKTFGVSPSAQRGQRRR